MAKKVGYLLSRIPDGRPDEPPWHVYGVPCAKCEWEDSWHIDRVFWRVRYVQPGGTKQHASYNSRREALEHTNRCRIMQLETKVTRVVVRTRRISRQ